MYPTKNKPLPASPYQGRRYNYFPLTRGIKGVCGFTLVELIVVITIVAILGTLAFTQMGSFQKDARDSKRITNISTIAAGFDINMAAGKLINTSETSTGYNIVITGSTFTMTGYYGQVNNKLLDSLKVYSKDITTTTDYPYSYSYFPTEKKYQVSSFLENSSNLPTAMNFIDQVYAETSTGYVFIKGNFSATGGINSLIPDATTWTDATGTPKVIAGSDTVVPGTSTSTPPIVVVYSNCIPTTYSGYAIPTINHTNSGTGTKSISYGTGYIQASCNDGALSYGSESVVCNSGYIPDGLICVVRPGSVSTSPGLSCKNILNTGGSIGDGMYWIKPDTNPAFQIYCDMTTDGGGWTLVWKVGSSAVMTDSNFATASSDISSLQTSVFQTGVLAKLPDSIINTLKSSTSSGVITYRVHEDVTNENKTSYWQGSCIFGNGGDYPPIDCRRMSLSYNNPVWIQNSIYGDPGWCGDPGWEASVFCAHDGTNARTLHYISGYPDSIFHTTKRTKVFVK